jgi:hypothetical protein
VSFAGSALLETTAALGGLSPGRVETEIRHTAQFRNSTASFMPVPDERGGPEDLGRTRRRRWAKDNGESTLSPGACGEPQTTEQRNRDSEQFLELPSQELRGSRAVLIRWSRFEARDFLFQ